MPRYLVTLPNETIDHDGLIKIEGGVLTLLVGSRFRAAFVAGQWLEVKEGDYAPERVPIPPTDDVLRVLFENGDLKAVTQLARLWKTDPQTAARAAVGEALEREQAASAAKASLTVRA